MKGLLVVNEFLMTEKFKELYSMFFEAAGKHKICLEQKTNAQLLPILGEEEELFEADFVLFWDKDIRLAKALENRGLWVANSAKAIESCDDKSLTHLLLEKAKVPMPKTILAPMTYPNIGYTNFDFLELAAQKLGFPMVVKECFGSFGWQVYLVKNRAELLELGKKLAGTPFLMQEFIKNSFGKDIRLQVVGNQVVAAMYRYSENGDFRANISNGGKMKAYEPTTQECELAVRACRVLGLDFAGVDILFGEAGPVICEVNSNAHFKNIYDCTGVNTAEHILQYLKKRGRV